MTHIAYPLRTYHLVIGALLLAFVSATALPVLAEQKPNIIFILTDDQGYGDASRHGHPLLETPHIDQFAEESVRFENFYVSPSCSPTRAALLTGKHEFMSGVTHTIPPREHLHRDATTLPDLLRTAGYNTGIIGKWHLGYGEGYSPNFRGFDWVSVNQGGSQKHFNPDIIRNGKRLKRDGFREDLFFDEAIAFIENSKEQPFFCYLSTFSPHTPLAAPDEFIEPFKGQVSDDQAKYLAMVANIDYNVGRLMAYLKEHKLDENTIVVFMNDNGVTVGLDVYNAGMRGSKCTIWQGGSRAMSFWRWPEKWKPQQIDVLSAHLDVLPTLCDLAGVNMPANIETDLEGFSLRPLLESDDPLPGHRERLLFHHVARWPGGLASEHKYAMAGVRQGHHLLLRSRPCSAEGCPKDGGGNQCETLRRVIAGSKQAIYTKENAAFHWGASKPDQWELYNTLEDPACSNDLSAGNPKMVKSLGGAYDNWWDRMYPAMIEAGGDRSTAKKAKE